MDGVSDLHLDASSQLSADAGRILRFRQNTNNRVEWPEYNELSAYTSQGNSNSLPTLDNFNLTDSCQLRTAMCCFSNVPIGSTNAKICTNDMSDNRKSHHINGGFGFYSTNADAFCVGFSWDSAPDSTSNRYKGNSLLDIAYGTFMDKGYTQSTEGAPLCGCVEKMPAVTNVQCRQISVSSNEGYTLTISSGSLVINQTSGSVSFSDCSNDLISSFSGNVEEKQKLTKRISECPKSEFLSQRFYVPGDQQARFTKPDSSKWTQFAGMGLSYFPVKSYNLAERESEFRQLLGTYPNYKVLYRHCESCLPSHQHIYYKRLTPYPNEMQRLHLFLGSWVSEGNELGEDFLLFGSYSDLLSGQGNWTYCNYDDGGSDIGFPNGCGPMDSAHCQWSSVLRENYCDEKYSGRSWGFYVEK